MLLDVFAGLALTLGSVILAMTCLHIGGFWTFKPLRGLDKRLPIISILLGTASKETFDDFAEAVPMKEVASATSQLRRLIAGMGAIAFLIFAVIFLVVTLATIIN